MSDQFALCRREPCADVDHCRSSARARCDGCQGDGTRLVPVADVTADGPVIVHPDQTVQRVEHATIHDSYDGHDDPMWMDPDGDTWLGQQVPTGSRPLYVTKEDTP